MCVSGNTLVIVCPPHPTPPFLLILAALLAHRRLGSFLHLNWPDFTTWTLSYFSRQLATERCFSIFWYEQIFHGTELPPVEFLYAFRRAISTVFTHSQSWTRATTRPFVKFDRNVYFCALTDWWIVCYSSSLALHWKVNMENKKIRKIVIHIILHIIPPMHDTTNRN